MTPHQTRESAGRAHWNVTSRVSIRVPDAIWLGAFTGLLTLARGALGLGS
jgi:hypothetical protein